LDEELWCRIRSHEEFVGGHHRERLDYTCGVGSVGESPDRFVDPRKRSEIVARDHAAPPSV
jgi:hypothetical protein